MPRYTDKEIADALREALGIQLKAAKLVGCNRSVIAERIKRSAVVRAAWVEGREMALDFCEDRLFSGIHNGEPWAIKFMLATQGQDRGYRERKEVEIKPAGPDLSAVPTAEIERIVAEHGRGKDGGKD